jgi:hypothetical protein
VDLTAWLLRHTPCRPLVVPVPGGTTARLAVERAVRERGWQPAAGPAEANVLVVAGVAGPALEPHVGRVWNSVPAPRVRVDVTVPHDAARQLDEARLALQDVARQREHGDHRPRHDMTHAEHHEMPEHHGDHGHHMGGMDMPGGLPMADRADDRDGLKLDQLRLPLGPVLPLWPAGLIVHTRIQGDVIQQASVELVGSGRDSFWLGTGEHLLVARRLDSSARLLALAGWADAATIAQRLRDEALGGASASDLLPPLGKWVRRVRRSRTLRWSLAEIGCVSEGSLAGDASTRLHRWLDSAERALLEPGQHEPADRHETQWTVDNLAWLLAGTELASARLLVASLDPDLDLLDHSEAHHG